MLLIKLVSDYVLENSRCVLGKFSKINRKPRENDFGLISCRRNVGKLSVNVRNIFVLPNKIKYLLTGLLVPYREILIPRSVYARTSQARSVLQNLGLSISKMIT